MILKQVERKQVNLKHAQNKISKLYKLSEK